MLFQDLPEIPVSSADTQLLAFESTSNTASRITNDYQSVLDNIIVNLVLARQTPDVTLDAHINNASLHVPLDDSSTSQVSTWSSSKITNAIDASPAWFNLDSIPEGAINQYYTAERGIELVNQVNQGVLNIDHLSIAQQLASVLLGFNSSTFRYDLVYDEVLSSPVTVTVDGVDTVDYFEVTPGTHIIRADRNANFVCAALAHTVSINTTLTQRVITPQLTLDAFTDGINNKIWNEETFAQSAILNDINLHLNNNFDLFHAPINDYQYADQNSTWSSAKIQVEILGKLSSFNPTANKEVAIAQEMASSGSHPAFYTWTTDDNGDGTYTHYIPRLNKRYDYRDNLSIFGDEIRLRPGTWFIWYFYDTTLNPYFTNVTDMAVYIARDNDIRTPVLEYPSTFVVPTGQTTYDIEVVTRFTCNQAYSSTYRNNWLVPKGVAGIDEFFGCIHVEKIR